jgi:predicted ATP-grasp superfamily ATP-dependent carboligase
MRVLLTYGWCRIAYVAAESLHRAGHEVYVCDSTRLSMTRFSRFIRGFDRTPDPFQFPEDYVAALKEIVQRRRIDLIFPVHEDVLTIQRRRDQLPREVMVAAPDCESLIRVLDKGEIVRIASSLGIAAPRTAAPADLQEMERIVKELSYPVVIKTRHGNSGKGVRRVDSAAEATEVYRDFVERFRLSAGEMPLIQEFLGGPVVGCCFIAKDGEVLASFAERYLRCKDGGFGTSVFRTPCDFPILHDYTARMARHLQWTGIGHFDFISDQAGSRFSLIEMNPRLWGALNLAVKNGYDFPSALVSLTAEGRVSTDAFRPRPRPLSSLWIVGEMIVGIAELKRRRFAAPLVSLARILFPGRHCSYDDFRWSDPLPLLVEMLYYGREFVASGGSINPVKEAMMR